MSSIVQRQKDALEALGECVVLCNKTWFAVYHSTWQARSVAARSHGRAGPNLIVYRTNSGQARDHHVDPHDVVADLVADETLTHSKVNGGVRWNFTLRDGKLHVSHRASKVDVTRFGGAMLMTESVMASEATSDPAELERRVSILQNLPSLPRPSGRNEPVARDTVTRAYARRADVKAWVLREAAGRCELCGVDARFRAADGSPYLEVHHARMLAEGGPDTVENAAAVCPTCHRRLHLGIDRGDCIRALYERVSRLAEWQQRAR